MDRFRRDDLASALNCTLLRTFVRVVDTGSMTQAAGSLFLAQSAVSTHVSTLASLAGGALLERRDGKLAPTRLGTILSEEARDILARVAVLDRRLHEAAGDEARSIAIACTRTVCETSVARVVSLFREAHPELRLAIATGTIKDVEVRLRSGETEIALVEGRSDIPGTVSTLFHVDRLLLAVPADHALATRSSVRFAEAARYPFVLRAANSGTRLLIEQRLGRRFEDVEIALELEGNSEVVSCIEASIGLGLLSETALTRAVSLGTIVAVSITDIDFSREFHLATAEGRLLSSAAAQFATWLTTRYQDARRASLVSA